MKAVKLHWLSKNEYMRVNIEAPLGGVAIILYNRTFLLAILFVVFFVYSFVFLRSRTNISHIFYAIKAFRLYCQLRILAKFEMHVPQNHSFLILEGNQ